MTNFYALVSMILLTNPPVEQLHPSGQEKFTITTISQQWKASWTWQGSLYSMTTNIPISTNVVREIAVWKKVPLSEPRNPLGLYGKTNTFTPPEPPKTMPLRIQHNPLGIPDQPPLPNFFR